MAEDEKKAQSPVTEATAQEEDLDAIMQELESLDEEAAQKPATADASAAKPTEKVRQLKPVTDSAKPAGTASAAAAGEQVLAMEVRGTVNLKLSFATGSKSVELACAEDALVCRFNDGTEVRIPTADPAATTLKRSA